MMQPGHVGKLPVTISLRLLGYPNLWLGARYGSLAEMD